MSPLNVLTLIVVIAGAINWGLLGLFQVDLVAALFGGPQTAISRVIYIVVGVSGIYQLAPLLNALSSEIEKPDDITAAGLRSGDPDRTGAVPERDADR